jgi:hypothetical protein
MTSKPKLVAATPDNAEVNGLIAIHNALISDPTQRRYAIVEFTVPDMIVVTGGDTVPRVKLTHIEVFEMGATQDKIITLLDAHYKARTKNSARPGPAEPDTPLDLSGLPYDSDRKWDAAAPEVVV